VYFNTDFELFNTWFVREKEEHRFLSHSWAVNLDVTMGVEIPDSLLRGPWTEDMIKYLFWLVKSGASVDFLNSTSGEVRSALVSQWPYD
jgi:hypothetical protein